MPRIGETVEEGTIIKWLKKIGDQEARDRALWLAGLCEQFNDLFHVEKSEINPLKLLSVKFSPPDTDEIEFRK